MSKGLIVMWSGVLANIPNGWLLCNGTLGTPDLRDRFIVGAPAGVDPGDTGGSATHTHDFTGDGHTHNIADGTKLGAGATFDDETDSTAVTGTTDSESSLPPYYKLAFLMKS